ncbi:MAG: ComEA family DNA-binding protein [Gemmatimonadaceae bacterium]
MGTPAERRALLFLSAVALLGAGVRGVRGIRNAPSIGPADSAALAAQIAAVESAQAAGTGQRKPSEGRVLRTFPARTLRPVSMVVPAAIELDVDRASAAELERLPGIGPVLASRVVAARDSGGPFGSLEGLRRRVKGIGPRLGMRLQSHVTFSLSPASSR